MKRISPFSLLLVMLFLSSASADEKTNISFYKEESQTRQLAEQMLTGSKIVVRVYNNYQADQRAYKRVSVPLAGLSVNHSAVKEAYPDIDESDIIVIVGRDQLDKTVAAVINDFVYADTYDTKKSRSVWPNWSRIPDYKYLVFTDALGQPIPRAKIEIFLSGFLDDDVEIHLNEMVLDTQGRMKPLILSGSTFNLVFVVSHPKYGKAQAHNNYTNQDNGRIVLPLVQLESEAATRATQGYVVDTQGNALEAMPVTYEYIQTPDNSQVRSYRGTYYRSITDEQGWFAMYIPTEKDGVLSRDLTPPGTQYNLSITPPKSSNLHQYHNPGVVVGSQIMITLTAMNPDEYFHTFTFMDGPDIITETEELQKVNITLYRGSAWRLWRTLKYDDFKYGCDLPQGRLEAHTTRWNKRFSFKPIQLTANSPEELVFKAGELIIYEGTVVEGRTGKPMPDVLVLVKRNYPREGFSELADQQLQSLRARAISSYNEVPSDKELYECDERVTLTDENGRYQFIFKTGLKEYLSNFIALEKGYVAEEPIHSGIRNRSDADGITVLPVIKMSPAEYSPVFVFEDEFGNAITDPNIFEHIRLDIERDDGRRWSSSYSNLINIGQFTRGMYYATLDWQGLHYVYEPVEVTWSGLQTILFKLQEVKLPEIIYQGTVIHGITGVPMPGAIVMNQGRVFESLDASDIQPGQWDAIHSLGPEPDPNDPALLPIRETFKFTKITRTDKAGQFKFALGHSMRGCIIAVEEDYLGAQQRLEYIVPIDENSPEPVGHKEFEPDADGYVKLPTMKLYPAATVTIEPNVPYVENTKYRIRFYFRTLPDDPTPWLNDFRAIPSLCKYDLKPNEFQTAYVLAGAELTLKIDPSLPTQMAPATIPSVKLEQGQFLDLGCVNFQSTFEVAVKVIDSAGQPVEGARVGCCDQDGFSFSHSRSYRPVTNENGKAVLHVPPYSSGEIFIFSFDRQTREKLREATPYKVAGEEDTARVFTLRLSDKIVRHLSENNLLRP